MNAIVRKATTHRKGHPTSRISFVSIGGRTLTGCILGASLILIIVEFKTFRRLRNLQSFDSGKKCDADCCRRSSFLSSRLPNSVSSSARGPDFYSLYAGELPGYTGWARPEITKVSLFQLEQIGHDNRPPRVGENWVIQIKCSSKECATSPTNRGALFYARAYGPAVIPGHVGLPVRGKGGDIYNVTFHFFDEGSYFVELVLTFSESYPFENYPLFMPHQIEPSYEGYMVQGFPMQITVTASTAYDNRESSSSLPWCTIEQLHLSESVNEQISFARWRVYDKNIYPNHEPKTSNASIISLQGYQSGVNSLGIKMDYQPSTCSLISERGLYNSKSGEHILDVCLKDSTVLGYKHETFRLIFVGDSVMDQQHMHMWQELISSMKNVVNVHTLISTHGGIKFSIDDVKKEMNSLLTPENSGEKRIVIFNTGLHDIDKLCAQHWAGSYEASMKIFRTTTAGWHKYGNFGFNWPADASQPFPTSTHTTHYFNEVALEVIKESQFTFHILDGYWLTVSRPDNTQVKTEQNEIGAHLVHYGPEVVSALNRQLLMLILHHICPQTLASWQPFP